MSKQRYILMMFLISSAVINAADLGREFWKNKYLAACVDVALCEKAFNRSKSARDQSLLALHKTVKQRYAQQLTTRYSDVYCMDNDGEVYQNVPVYADGIGCASSFTKIEPVSQPSCSVM